MLPTAPISEPKPARRRLVPAFAALMRFYTRLPVPAVLGDPALAPDLARGAPLVALVGAVVGLIGGGAYGAAALLGLQPLVAALIALAAATAATGALHEDGFADFADCLGGRTRERRLEIMRDSRLGSFGALALVLSAGLRAAALAAIATGCGGAGVLAAFVAAAALGRTSGLMPLTLLPPARAEGLGRTVGAPSGPMLAAAILAGALLALPALAAGVPTIAAVAAMLAAPAVAFGVTASARRLLGGQTGDVCGAAAHAAEIAALVALSAAA